MIGDTEAKKWWYHTDHLGSVKAVTKADGSLAWKADYLPFGQQHVKEKIDPTFEEDDLGFTGKGYDAEIGLYYFNARWYDADTGRFISEDQVADPNNPNLYTYCRNNPLRFIDPTGLAIMTTGNGGTYDTGTGTYTPPGGPPAGSTPTGDGGYTSNSAENGDSFTMSGDGSSKYQFESSETDNNTGVTRSSSGYSNLDANGNVLFAYNDTVFSKPGQGSVAIRSTTIGNITETRYQLRDAQGNPLGTYDVETIAIIAIRGWGRGTAIPATNNITGEVNIYDDMMIVVDSDAMINVFDEVNLEGTTASGYWDSYIAGKNGTFLTMPNGRRATTRHFMDGTNPVVADTEPGSFFTINNVKHKGRYDALSVNGGGDVPTIGVNPNDPKGNSTARGINIHIGGDRGWNYSEGCFTMPASRWDSFISLFPTGTPGKQVGIITISTL